MPAKRRALSLRKLTGIGLDFGVAVRKAAQSWPQGNQVQLLGDICCTNGGVCRLCGIFITTGHEETFFTATRSGPGALLVSLLDGTLVSLDPLTGAELWAEPFNSGQPLIRSVPAEAPGPPAPPGGGTGEAPAAAGSLAAVFPGLDGALYAYADGGGSDAGKSRPRGLQVRPQTASSCGRLSVCVSFLLKGARLRTRRSW